MKELKQIAKDCGLTSGQESLLYATVLRPQHDDATVLGAWDCIIGALYRRIETLENGPYEAEEGADVCSVCDTVFAPKTLLAINEAEFELICPECMLARIRKLEEEKECHIAEIKALESAVAGNAERIRKLEAENASFIKDLKLQSIRIAELEIWSDENQGL